MKQELTYTQRQDLQSNVTPTPKKPDKKTNKDFQKIFFDKMDYLMQLNQKSPAALSVYLLLIKYADTNNIVYLTIKMIRESLHLSNQAVISAIKLLRQDGYLTTYKVGTVNFYFLNPDISVSCTVPFQRKIREVYIDKVEKELNDYKNKFKDLEGLDSVEDKDMIAEIREDIEKTKRPANFLCDIDKTRIDTDIIESADRLRVKVKFFKNHPELHAPTEKEIEEQNERDEWNDANLTSYGELKDELDGHTI